MNLFGMEVIVYPDRPRYQLPAELLPGIPWPAGFRDDFNAWAVGFLGTVPLIDPNAAYVLHGRTLVMGPRAFAALQRQQAQGGER